MRAASLSTIVPGRSWWCKRAARSTVSPQTSYWSRLRPSNPAVTRAHVDTDANRPALAHLGHGSAQLQCARSRAQDGIGLGPAQPAYRHDAGPEALNRDQAAVAEPDAELRGEAIQSVSVYHGAEAVAVLTEVAASDPDTDNRVQALHTLWNAAADGRDQEGAIKRILEDARADPDADIAELAQKALADLERLAALRANAG